MDVFYSGHDCHHGGEAHSVSMIPAKSYAGWGFESGRFNLARLAKKKSPDKGQAQALQVGGWAWG